MDVTFALTQPAKLAMYGYLALLISMVLSFVMTGNRQLWLNVLTRLGFFVIAAAISVYVINCTIVGACHLYAWVVGYVIAVLGTVTVLMMLFKGILKA